MTLTYAQVGDLINYAPQLSNLDENALEALIEAAEQDLDKMVLPPAILTASRQQISAQGIVTGGTWRASLAWLGNNTFVSDPIPWDATETEVLAELNIAANVYGVRVPESAVWRAPETTPSAMRFPQGPLPGVPVTIEASSDFAEQRLNLLTIDSSGLVGGGSYVVTELSAGGLKVDPAWLSPLQAVALNRATCAQAEYRNMMGANFFIRAQYNSVNGPVFNTTGKLPLVGPKVKRELSQSGLLLVGARASQGHSRRPAGIGLGWPPSHTPEGGDVW